ncbi:cytochrome c551 [Oceanobacillus polygoni]|uniref:Cytochrome c551 n=1 Tax=Oceanobacillus polygoni TaxID=1235259 RepID=A0A9X0YVR9_9BACI|nr:cytochrome c [Oceanobacillus polygoni]MBP2078921.1 cytochrome c551 [Oceanobacillus polygoni]
MKKWLVAVLFGAVLALGACGAGDDNASDDTGTDDSNGGAVESAAGEEVYKANCAACHGADLSGGAGPDLAEVGSKYSQAEIEDIVTNGKGSMPAINVAGEDLDALTSWLSEKQ